MCNNFFMPPPFIMGGGGEGHIASPLSVRPYVHIYVGTYICTYVPYVRKRVSGRYLLKTLVY